MGWPPIKGKLHVTETGLSSDLMDNLASMHSQPAVFYKYLQSATKLLRHCT